MGKKSNFLVVKKLVRNNLSINHWNSNYWRTHSRHIFKLDMVPLPQAVRFITVLIKRTCITNQDVPSRLHFHEIFLNFFFSWEHKQALFVFPDLHLRNRIYENLTSQNCNLLEAFKHYTRIEQCFASLCSTGYRFRSICLFLFAHFCYLLSAESYR